MLLLTFPLLIAIDLPPADEYFKSSNHTDFLDKLRLQAAEAEGMSNDSVGVPRSRASSEKDLLEMEKDVRAFLRSNGDSIQTGRELARVLHGLHAPSSAAQSRAAESHARFQNRSDPHAVPSQDRTHLSAWQGTVAWGRYKEIPFPLVLAKCEAELQVYQETAGERMQAAERELEQRKSRKRLKTGATTVPAAAAVAVAVSTSTRRVSSVSAVSMVKVRPPLGLSLSVAAEASHPVAAGVPATEDDVMIPASDEEAEDA
jgi:hypothetical protein